MDMVVETDPTGRFARSSEVLGKGASKTVYKAFDRIEGREVAWNQALLTSGSMQAAHGLLHTEVKVLNTLKHRHIMKFYASWVDDELGTINFITEYFASGTLKRHRLAHRSFDLNMTLMKRWTWQILQGLVYLHGRNPPVIHRDLKCDNIFIHGVSGVVKIGDLGLARLMEENLSLCHTCIGTPEFMAPELYNEAYNEKVDIYSFGMLILELVTMTYPYSECKTACQIYRHVTEGIPPAALATIEDEETREFIKLCTRYDHEQRPSARQLVKHKYFDDVRAPSPSSKLFCPSSRPELAMDSSSLVSENTQESLPTLAECQSAPERFAACMTSDASMDDGDKDGLPFVETISDADECARGGSKKCESVVSGGDTDAQRPESVFSALDTDQSLTKRQFSLQHKGSTALPFVDVVNFELVFGGPGATKKLMFSFDVLSDTVEDVGLELEEEYSLTPEETDQFTTMLKQELERAMHNSSLADHQPHVLGTFGSIQVSMSLDDWTNNHSGNQAPLSHRSGDKSGVVRSVSGQIKSSGRSGKTGPKMSFKINVEQSQSVRSLSSCSLKLSTRSLNAQSAKAASSEELKKKKKSTDGEGSKKRKSYERNDSINGFAFEKPGGMWRKLVQHLHNGANSIRRRSTSHRRCKMGRIGGDSRAKSQEDPVQANNCTDVMARAADEEGSVLSGEAGTLSEGGTPRQAPLVQKRRSSLNLAARSLTPVVNQVRLAAGAVKHIKEAAVILCRNSLEGKKVLFEIRRKGGSKKKGMAEAVVKEQAETSRVEVVEEDKVFQDSAKILDVPDQHVNRAGSCGPAQPTVEKHGSRIFRPLRKAAKKAMWPWRRKRGERL
ncbi:unnamed protein product [Ostreobium quekettii]|uniref:non-specific serine/threonine protein kinase n=1 Tax=Ostreobium quekettii TaxID=121088 RepID=A0A8S1JI13_9CHLO|nr:unnamed protein product [Ostreobium quekettii]